MKFNSLFANLMLSGRVKSSLRTRKMFLKLINDTGADVLKLDYHNYLQYYELYKGPDIYPVAQS